ncbi:MAG TPA: aminopeptidase [Anaerolineales bacterium]|nr:aminopeptidase [Anaerolineales bacterium]
MTDNKTVDKRLLKHADILVDYCTEIQPGDRVVIESTIAAEPMLEALMERILVRGGYPYLLTKLPQQEAIFYKYAQEAQLVTPPEFMKLAYDNFEARIRLHSVMDTSVLDDVDPEKQALHGKAIAPILEAQFSRGPSRDFKWVTTLFPTEAYAKEAGMTLEEYTDFVYAAMHANTDDPVAFWQQVEKDQEHYVSLFKGKDKVVLRGPNVDLRLSVKGRSFINANGKNNMPDGEIFTGPVENSVNGWVRYTYPSIVSGQVVEDIELEFVEGQVLHAKAKKNQDFLMRMLDSDAGARYVGEFAVGLNYEIDKFTGNILFDEKIGGSFHMALGAGYPETGSKNKSQIHWDMICDMRTDSEIIADGEVIYKNGNFVK